MSETTSDSAVRSGSETDASAADASSHRSSQMLRIGIGFCVFAIAVVLADTVLVEWRREALPWPVLSAGALGWGLLVASEAFKKRLASPLALERFCTLTVFSGFLALYAVTSFPATPYNEQVRQAVAFLHGHTYIDAPKAYLEAAQVGPYRYALHPPLPAIMLVPFVAIWGMATDQAIWSLFIGALDLALAWRLLGRFRLSPSARVWLTVFFGAGTILWFETITGNTWALPETVSVLFTLAALDEAFGSARPLLLGSFAGLAALSRYELAFAGFTYAVLALKRGRRIRDIFWMVPGFAAVGAVFIGYNEARYASFFDQGVTLTGPSYGPAFGLRYLLGNLSTVFLMEPGLNEHFPYVHISYIGQSVTFTSPAFLLAFKAYLGKLEPALMLLTAIVVSIPSLLCYANGFAQFGTRHYLQVFPFLLVMMAMGMRRADRLTKILIVTSIIFIAYGVVYVHIWGLF